MTPPPTVSFTQALLFWLKLGFISFGGPAGQIAIMQRELVDERRWISQARFNHALNYCMLLPGPEAQQLATWIGLQFHGVRGALFAGISFVVPAAILMWILSYGYFAYASLPSVSHAVFGLKCAVIVLISHALYRFAKRSLKTPLAWSFAALCFACLAFGYPYLASIAIAGLVSALLTGRAALADAAQPKLSATSPEKASPVSQTTGVLLSGISAALLLIALLVWTHQQGSQMLWQLTALMTKAALVTIGGAYAVLPFVFDQALHYGWLDSKQAMAGLALAESTPGPLVIVLGFVGFAVGWQFSAGQSPIVAATISFSLALLCTFLPSLALVFCGSLVLERISRWRRAKNALEGISQAVIGGIAWLALQFAIALFWPNTSQTMPNLAALSLVASLFYLQFRYGLSSAKLVLLGLGLSVSLGLFSNGAF
jgi:chromate transporter